MSSTVPNMTHMPSLSNVTACTLFKFLMNNSSLNDDGCVSLKQNEEFIPYTANVVENRIEQCFAANIVHNCQQYCSALLHST